LDDLPDIARGEGGTLLAKSDAGTRSHDEAEEQEPSADLGDGTCHERTPGETMEAQRRS
jgi:hypothetical protein